MNAITVTPWFGAEVKPVHVGLYEVHRGDVSYPHYPRRTFLQWDGERWTHTLHSAAGQPDMVGAYASMCGRNKWRGVLQ